MVRAIFEKKKRVLWLEKKLMWKTCSHLRGKRAEVAAYPYQNIHIIHAIFFLKFIKI